MLSVLEVKRKLPKDFIENLYKNYTPVMADKILAGLNGKRNVTLRVNTLKYSINELMKYFKEINIKFERVPFFNEALIIKNQTEKQIQKLDIYEKGFIYLQSLPSMLPPLILNPKPGEKILDLTAAPGSKTTQIASLMENKGYILANELDKIRCKRLEYNINMQGVKIAEVSNKRGEIIGKLYEEQFDKVLLDAPCSGEGRFLANDAKTYRGYNKKQIMELSKLQKKLLKSANQAVKPNGEIVYSTCTLNLEENEKVLQFAIKELNLKLIDIKIKDKKIDLKNAMPAFSIEGQELLKKAIRILPNENYEGFFVAKFQKKLANTKKN